MNGAGTVEARAGNGFEALGLDVYAPCGLPNARIRCLSVSELILNLC